jgi:hypothetical protein
MGAGFLNVLSESDSDNNIILVGNPSKTLFKKTIVSHTNFGKQKFRIDFEGNTRLNYTTPTLYNFKIPRYGDLLQEIFFSFTLPNIWSPLIAFGGTPVVFCSACRTNIKTNLDYLTINNNNSYSFNTNQSITTCGLCDCSCNSQSEVSDSTLEFLQTNSNMNMKLINRVYPLEFKWIENIGVQVINSIRIFSNNSIIQEFSGQYLLNMVWRDFTDNQKKIFNKMIGNVPELNNPAHYSNRNGNYPNAAYFGSLNTMSYGIEPSIRSRQLLIPINLWSTLNNKTPIPLVAMQYSELRIEIELKPVNEWWVVKNVINEVSININNSLDSFDTSTNSTNSNNSTTYNELNNLVGILHNTYSAPNCNNEIYNLKLFLKEPPRKNIINTQTDLLGASLSETGALVYPLNSNKLLENYYKDVPSPWFADIHLIGCYTFLTNEEQLFFSQNTHSYLIKEVHEQKINDLIGGSHFTEIQTTGLVVSWMWFFQRSDVKYRNEWSNYSNYNYNNSNSEIMTLYGLTDLVSFNSENINITNKLDSIVWQKKFTARENKDILLEWGLYFNNSIREITLEKEFVSYIDIYSRSQGSGLDNVFYYNFCLNTDPLIYQPCGAINMSKINNVYMSYKLIDPLLKISIRNETNYISNISDPFLYASVIGSYLSNSINSNVTCSATNNEEQTTVNLKDTAKYVWHYTLHLMEERYNILKIINGVANLQFVRSL